MPQRSCARLHHQSAIRGERLAKERLRCHGLDARVEWWARRQRCSMRCGGLGVRTQPLLLPRADRPAAAHSFPSDAICKRRPVGYAGLWFRRNFAFGWFTDLPDYLFGGLAFCLCGSLHLRDPGSFSLCLLGRFALDLAGGFTLRLLRRLALRAFGSLDL